MQAGERRAVLVSVFGRQLAEEWDEGLHLRVEDEVVALEYDGRALAPLAFEQRLDPGTPRKPEEDHDRVRREAVQQAGVVDVHHVGGEARLAELLDAVLTAVPIWTIPARRHVEDTERGRGHDRREACGRGARPDLGLQPRELGVPIDVSGRSRRLRSEEHTSELQSQSNL